MQACLSHYHWPMGLVPSKLSCSGSFIFIDHIQYHEPIMSYFSQAVSLVKSRRHWLYVLPLVSFMASFVFTSPEHYMI